MSEQVIRHRGPVRDEDGKYIPGSDTTLQAFAVAPGGGSEFVDRYRDGENIAAAVYFKEFVDLTNADELTVRDERYQIIVNEWRSPWTGFGGLEVLCTRGQG